MTCTVRISGRSRSASVRVQTPWPGMPAACVTPARTRYSATICAPVRRCTVDSEAVPTCVDPLPCKRLHRGTLAPVQEPMSTPDMLTASPLARTVSDTATDIWNDSCNVDELSYAVAFGAVGATANPTIVVDNWKKDPDRWAARVRELADEQSAFSERELAWAIVAEMSVRAAPLLMPAFEASGGRAGRLSVQTDPTLHRDAPAMVTQAFGFTGLAPNVVVKFPTTAAGVAAMEEASYQGISVNATVSFSVAQALAAAEAVQRGIDRRTSEGLPTDDMGPVITIMMGRIEDWLRVVAEREGA